MTFEESIHQFLEYVNKRGKKRIPGSTFFPFECKNSFLNNTSGAIYCGVPQNVAVVCPNGTSILHKPKSTNLIWP